MIRPHVVAVAGILGAVLGGCGDVLLPPPAPLFTVPLAVDGQSVGPAIIDTGGDFEILLRDDFGLEIVGTVEVRVFGGRERVDVTEGFRYAAGGIHTATDGAIVGVSSCDCNGVGVKFFRKTGLVLGLSFSDPAAMFLFAVPEEGVPIAFLPPPETLADFDTSFIDVEVAAGGTSRKLLGLLDTGASLTTMRRGLFDAGPVPWADLPRVTVTHDALGTVSVSPLLFDTEELPDLIIGTDVMRAWGDRWYFSFAPEGGTVTVVPNGDFPAPDAPATFRRR